MSDGVEIRDWPTMRYRGSIEGFYGTPWSHADRLDHLDYLGAHRMNTYEYAPKDDPYHREQWRDPYPADKLAELGELVDRARQNKVDFTFALSPGLSICYTDDADFQALIAKFEALYALGARSFNVAAGRHRVRHVALRRGRARSTAPAAVAPGWRRASC